MSAPIPLIPPAGGVMGDVIDAGMDADELEEDDMDDLETCSNLIVNYLPPTMSETELRRLFAPHGTIQHVKVVTDRSSGRSMGCVRASAAPPPAPPMRSRSRPPFKFRRSL